MIFMFSVISCNTVKYAKEENLVEVREPIERSDYPDTEEAFFSIQNILGRDMTINRAEAQMAAKSELALKIQQYIKKVLILSWNHCRKTLLLL